MADVYVGLGSNVGDRGAMLHSALARLRENPAIEVMRVSRFIETHPVGGPPGQGMFLNGAALLRVALSPEELLEELLRTEAALGRVRRQRWGPRTIDLDLLLYNDLVLETARLTLPHPRMHERRFVLEPLAEIAPEARHPLLGRTVAQLLDRLKSQDE